jgi:hypothetical protein
MKPDFKPIDPAKRTEVPQERVLTPPEASLITRVFLVLLLVPMLFEISAWISPGKTNLLAAWTRTGVQRALTWTLKQGSDDVFLGHEGWLFEQRELDRLLAHRTAEAPANEAVAAFGAELKKRGIPLVLVAVPERATLYPEKLREGRYWDPIRATGEKARLEALRKTGIDVLDLTDPFWKLRDRKQVYFRRDSHWTPEAMKQAALLTEKHLREKLPALLGTETPLITATILTHLDAGDLTRKLDPRSPDKLFGLEQAEVVSIGGIELDEKSPILLVGGDLMWIYDDETPHFGGDSSAGFVSQMALLAQKPLDVEVWPNPNLAKLDGKKLVVLVLPMSEVLP